MNFKQLIQTLIDHEDDYEAKLDLLTTIGVTTTNNTVFTACEDVRNELVTKDGESERSKILGGLCESEIAFDSHYKEGSAGMDNVYDEVK